MLITCVTLIVIDYLSSLSSSLSSFLPLSLSLCPFSFLLIFVPLSGLSLFSFLFYSLSFLLSSFSSFLSFFVPLSFLSLFSFLYLFPLFPPFFSLLSMSPSLSSYLFSPLYVTLSFSLLLPYLTGLPTALVHAPCLSCRKNCQRRRSIQCCSQVQ